MKKKSVACATGAISLAMVLSMAACGTEPVSFDREAKAFDAPDATISVDAKTDKKSARYNLSDTLFGVFLEDINYASYALDDNLLVNHSFETPQGKRNNASVTANHYGWRAEDGASLAVKENQSDGPLGTLYKDYQNQYVNGGYAVFTATADGGKLINAGYADPAMAVKEGTQYLFSAFIRNDGGALAELKLAVKDGQKTYASGTIAVQGDGWVKYQKMLTAEATGTEGLYFELSVSGACRLALDGVKLETQDAALGIKNYVYEAIEQLSPKFIRFPGGCVIEGVDEGTAYDWKNSIGAVARTRESTGDDVPAFEYTLNDEGNTKTVTTYGEQITRRANTDIWQGGNNYYEMEYGIGFYDYFLLCEKLGASPVPVISCGLSDQGGLQNAWGKSAHALAGRHGNKIADYIQDALDLVCFANGSVDSDDENEARWARIRTDMGHPAPFGLKYLGIGNEQYGNYYETYYQKFLEAFAQAKGENALYGEVELIVGNAMTLGDCQNTAVSSSSTGMAQRAALSYLNSQSPVIDTVAEYGIHDQHYYMNFLDFFKNTEMYDGYARPEEDGYNYYNVFVGEYSANSYSSGGSSYDPKEEWTNSWITALSEAAMMTAYERNGDIIKLAAYAPMFASLNGSRQWNVDMMYFTNTEIVRTTNYYVQQLFMRNQGKYLLKNQSIAYADGFAKTYELAGHNGRKENISKLYYTASLNADGDIVLKIVNASGEDINVNVAVSNARLKGTARVTALQNDDMKAVNRSSGEAVAPQSYTAGAFGKKLGYTAKKYSVTAIVFDVK